MIYTKNEQNYTVILLYVVLKRRLGSINMSRLDSFNNRCDGFTVG